MILDDVCGLIDNNLAELIHTAIILLKIGIPVLLIIFGMLDFGKGVISGKEDEIKSGQHMFIKRVISAFLVFFVVTIVQTVIQLADDKNSDNESDTWNCANLIMNGKTSTGSNKKTAVDGTICQTENAAKDYSFCIKNSTQDKETTEKVCSTIFKNKCTVVQEPMWTKSIDDRTEEIVNEVFNKEALTKEEAINEVNWYGNDVVANIQDVKESYYDCLKANIGYNNCQGYFKSFIKD